MKDCTRVITCLRIQKRSKSYSQVDGICRTLKKGSYVLTSTCQPFGVLREGHWPNIPTTTRWYWGLVVLSRCQSDFGTAVVLTIAVSAVCGSGVLHSVWEALLCSNRVLWKTRRKPTG